MGTTQMRFRSGLEERTAKYLKKLKVKFTYEKIKIRWQDLRYRTYTPDFVLANGIIVETKGRFITSDRQKHLMIKSNTLTWTLDLFSLVLTLNFTKDQRQHMLTGVISMVSNGLKKKYLLSG